MTGDSSGPLTLSTDELLGARELEWSRKLRAISLVTEYAVEPRHADQTLTVLARLYRQTRHESWTHADRVLRRWPAVQVVSTVNVAIGHYNQGNFWSSFFDRADLNQNQEVQSAWGSAFLDNLRALGLPDFSESEDAGTKYVGRMLMHAGMPTYCLPDYYLLVAERRHITANLSPEAFVAWAVSRAEQDRLSDVDKPVVRFLRYGGDYAIDLVDRTFELLDQIVAGRDGSDVPLPPRFATTASDLMARGALGRAVQRRGRSADVDGLAVQPYLAIDPFGRGPLIRLPPVSEAPDGVAIWQVIVDGRRETVQSRALWPGSTEPVPGTDLPILRPSRSAAVGLLGHDELQSAVSIVDETDPLLAFDEDGKSVSGVLPLPSAAVWMLYPNLAQATDLIAYEGEPRRIAAGVLPAGWSGWSLELVDLTEVTSLRLRDSTRLHTVRGVQAARIASGEPIPGLRSSYGSPVFVALPVVELPSSRGELASWDVTITDGASQILARMSTAATGSFEGLWDDVPRPLLGSYTIRVRGPWGRGGTRTLVVAEGLRIQASPAWRRFARGGLIPARADFQPTQGMSVNYEHLDYDRSTLTAHVVLSTEHDTESFQFTPPHMTVSYETDEAVGRATVLPAQLETEALIENAGTLTIDIGESAEPSIRVISGGAILQTVVPGARAAQGIYRFDLARIVDTVRACRAATLSLDNRGDVTVGVVRPRRLTSGITIDSSGLNFSDCPDITGLAAAVYALRAPWRTPASLPITAGRADLPSEYLHAGPLLVSLRVEDPWFPVVLPPWPAERNARPVEANGYLQSEDEEESALSAFLADAAAFPSRTQRLDRLWATLGRAGLIAEGTQKSTIRRLIADRLLETPKQALLAVETAGIDAAGLPSVLIESGLMASPVMDVDADDLHDLWASSPMAAAVMLRDWLSGLRSSGGGVPLDMMDAAVAQCGPVASALLCGGPDPAAAAGRFDAAADRYALMDDTLRDSFRAAMALIPRGLLDADTRTQAAMLLVDRRSDLRLRAVSDASGRLLKEAMILLNLSGMSGLAASVRARMHPNGSVGWRALSSLSLAFALVGRQSARGSAEASAWLRSARPYWVKLARVAPELVKIDIVLAELLSLVPELTGRKVAEDS